MTRPHHQSPLLDRHGRSDDAGWPLKKSRSSPPNATRLVCGGSAGRCPPARSILPELVRSVGNQYAHWSITPHQQRRSLPARIQRWAVLHAHHGPQRSDLILAHSDACRTSFRAVALPGRRRMSRRLRRLHRAHPRPCCLRPFGHSGHRLGGHPASSARFRTAVDAIAWARLLYAGSRPTHARLPPDPIVRMALPPASKACLRDRRQTQA